VTPSYLIDQLVDLALNEDLAGGDVTTEAMVAVSDRAIARAVAHSPLTVCGGDVFARCEVGTFDGIRLDSDGRVWAAAGDGLHCFDPDGTPLGKLHVPEIVANLTFGGPQRNQIFMCATSSVYSIRVTVRGARYPG